MLDLLTYHLVVYRKLDLMWAKMQIRVWLVVVLEISHFKHIESCQVVEISGKVVLSVDGGNSIPVRLAI